jgi:2-oxoglutarate dehydrogenase E2 component (dihydrolipoamide succinyltransferase)
MNRVVQIVLPKLGESILTARVIHWLKNVGDMIHLDEALLEVATDKVNSEIPSPVAGKIHQILVQPGEEVPVGAVLALIEPFDIPSAIVPEKSPERGAAESPSSEMKDFYSPALLRFARDHGLELQELKEMGATGAGGRLTIRDLEEHIAQRERRNTPPLCSARPIEQGVEKIKMTRLRKIIAEKMAQSYREVPHATLVMEVDVTSPLKFAQQYKAKFLADYGVKLTITPFVAWGIAQALQKYPLLNASLEEDTIIIKRYVNLGIAVSVNEGVIVPVIPQCQTLTLPETAQAIHALAERARKQALKVEDIEGGTITLTNFGMSGVAIGIPIIRHPEVAILGIGAISKKVAVTSEDGFAIRSLMHISLTFDHRIFDGMYGCEFLHTLKVYLEKESADYERIISETKTIS